MAEGTASAGYPARADWGKAAEGIQMAGFAVFLLLNTTGVLPWSFWLDAISLWPVLIVAAGLKIAVEKSPFPWLMLLGPVIVLGSLAWLASGRRPEAPVGPWEPASIAREAGTERLDFEAALAGARLHLAAADDVPAGRLVDGRTITREGETRLDSEMDGGSARVRIRGGKRNVVFLPRPQRRFDLRVPAGLPLAVRVKGAGVSGDLDLTRAPFEGSQSEGVFIGLDLRLPAPRRDTEIKMSGVFNSLTIAVPEGTPVRVHGPGLPFNAVDRGVKGEEGRPGYDVNVQGMFSAVEIRTDRGISPEPPPAEATPPPAPAEAPRPPAEAPAAKPG
ncbi:MAG TPA: hypothetical protein VGB87_10180 [Vicinamibacteria bacterium]